MQRDATLEAARSINRNILECKGSCDVVRDPIRFRINRNILECKGP